MYFPQWIKKHGFLKQTYLNAQGLVFGSKALVDCIVCKTTILDLRLMFGDSLSHFSSNITVLLCFLLEFKYYATPLISVRPLVCTLFTSDEIMEKAFNWTADFLGITVEKLVEVAKSKMRRHR